MRYHLYLQYGWFLQNLGKDFIPTNMHTTVYEYIMYRSKVPRSRFSRDSFFIIISSHNVQDNIRELTYKLKNMHVVLRLHRLTFCSFSSTFVALSKFMQFI